MLKQNGLYLLVHNLFTDKGVEQFKFIVEYFSNADSLTSENLLKSIDNRIEVPLTVRKVELYNFISHKISEEAKRELDPVAFILSERLQKLSQIRKICICRLFVVNKTEKGLKLDPNPIPFLNILEELVKEFNEHEIWDKENNILINLNDNHIDVPINIIKKLKNRNAKAESAIAYLIKKGLIS